MKIKRISLLTALCLAFLLLVSCAAVPAASEAEEFDFTELAHVFALTDDLIFEAHGAPDGESQTAYRSLDATELRYGDNVYCVENQSHYLYYARIYDDALAAPRGAEIGMRLDDFAALFSASGEREIQTTEDGEEYLLLYGTYLPGYSYGVLIYDGGSPRLFEYAKEGCIFAAGIKNNRVEYFEYIVE